MQLLFQPAYLAIFLLFFLIGLTIHFLIRVFFKKLKILDKPDGKKKKHKDDIPISGGFSFILSLVIFITLWTILNRNEFLLDLFEIDKILLASPNIDIRTSILIFLTGLIVAGVSLFDDILDLPVWFRFMILIFCCITVILLGDINLTGFGNLLGFGEITFNPIIGILITIFCVVGISNAFNWIDGLDGLFSIQTLIAATSIFFFMGINGLFFIFFVIAFMPYLMMNLGFFGEKTKVFIGDHGAMATGYVIAWLLVVSAENNLFNYMTAPWIVGLVLMNSLRVILKRLFLKVSIFRSDREHVHHFFLDKGFSRTKVLLILTTLSIFITAIGICIETFGLSAAVSFYTFITVFCFWTFSSYYLNKKN